MQRWITLPCLAAALALSGCASTRLVDSDVQAFSHWDAPHTTPDTYRFERLPSQQAQGGAQAAIEAQAAQALAKVGLHPAADGTAPSYRVQVHARTERQRTPGGYDPWWGWGGWGWGSGHGFYGGLSMRLAPPPTYRSEVSLVLRQASSGAVVYETHAVHEGVWSDDHAVLGALFEAALDGFPRPPAGLRRIHREIPR